MANLSKRSTIFLDPAIHEALKMRVLETSRSMSEIINEALSEDAEDLAAFEERAGEPLISFDEMAEMLDRNGRI